MSKKQRQELDFLFIYEHKVRELENLCLMKYELDRRGYKTQIIHIEDEKALKAVKPYYYAKVVVLMACYDNHTLEWHTKDFVKFEKAIDLQWENIVYPMDEKNQKAYKNYTGVAKEVVRISWGEKNRQRMLDVAKMDPKKIKLIGHVGMDYLRDELKGYYSSRGELFREYGLAVDKEVYLFISPFFSDCLDESYITKMCERFGEGWRDYYQSFMLNSKKTILDWIRRVCEQRQDLIFIYRPHPGEKSETADRMAQKLSNFKVIGDKSVKQWILASDKIYTGNSSTFVEAFFAKKMCYMLFPYPAPEDYELEMIKGADKITNFEAFQKSTQEKDGRFPIREELIDEVYSIDWEKPSYVKFADMAEEVYKDPYYNLTKEQLKSYRTKQSISVRIIKALSKIDCLYHPYLKLVENENIHWKWLEPMRASRKKVKEIVQRQAFEQTNDKEVADIIAKISAQLNR